VYLKSLKLAGFKSFADRTRLEFRPGVSVVVGPNGAGKSNLVDALSWVLGTQSAKSLRTPKMEDVIFAGTAARPALNRAEVVLVIDNTDRLIDLDLDEVSITRRLYRDGSSDYELNGVSCRLLDIQDLLSDSGVGRQQHVIIGQGEIGQVLNASPEEHRAVIEEAAGILKHRRRKERAERRLERTDEDLIRLQDIIGELNRQMRPLRRQARAAERYQGLKDEVVALRLYLGGRQLAEFDRELTVVTSEKVMLAERSEVDRGRLGELERAVRNLTAEVGEVSAALDRDSTSAAMLETTKERLRRIGSVAHERARAASGRIEAVEARQADLVEEAVAIDSELADLESAKTAAQTDVETAEARFRRLEAEEKSLATQTALSPEGALAAVRGELSALIASIERDRREVEGLDRRLEVLRSQVESETAAISDIDNEIRLLDASISGVQADYDDAVRRRTLDQARWTAAEESLSEARTRVATAEARVEAIAAALTGRLDEEARALVESAPETLGRLVALLDVPEGLEAAVAAALGPWSDAVAVADRQSLRTVTGRVKSAGGGSVSIVAATGDGIAPAVPVARAKGLDALAGLLGPRADQRLARALLGDVVLVEGWSTGWDIVGSHPDIRAVTPEGDLITSGGALLATADGATPVLLETAEVALERARTEEARAVSLHTAARRDFEQSRDHERTCLEALEAAEAGLAGKSEAMDRLVRSVVAVETELVRLQERRTALVGSVESAENQAEELNFRIDALQGEETERLRIWEELEARRSALAVERETARSQWQEAAGAMRVLVERAGLLSQRKARVADDLSRLEQSTTAPAGDPEALAVVERTAAAAVSIIETKLASLRDRQAIRREEKDRLGAELSAARNDFEACREALSSARDRTGELEVRLTELRLQKEAVAEAIRRDADADPDRAYGAPRPEYPEGADLNEVLATKRAELQRLGPINPLAAAEYRELEERHEFLTSQVADVESSRSELRKVISALEHEIRDTFTSAFDEVAEAFQRYFSVLFPGGKGRIRLADPDDRDSGVLIDAQPMGKKLTQMTLLSGGERSLAALAFLFAVFEARPSPFYVLDEVEAALDDVNLRRFLRIVDEFRGRAQLIIVTHQQQTMEAADVLYGVTMEAGGSSQALRKDMTEAAIALDA
jgi:chromosome segregation protein